MLIEQTGVTQARRFWLGLTVESAPKSTLQDTATTP